MIRAARRSQRQFLAAVQRAQLIPQDLLQPFLGRAAGAVAGGFLKAQAAVPDSAVQQTCGLRFEVRADEQGRPVLHRCQYVN